MTGSQQSGRLSPGRWRELFWLLVEPAVSITSRQERRQARLLSTALLILIVIGSMIQMGEFRQPGWSELRDLDFWISGASVVMFAGLYGLSRSRRYRWAARIVVGFMSVATFLIALPYEDSSDPGLLVYLVLPVLLSSVLLSTRATGLLIAAQTTGTILYNVLLQGYVNDNDWSGFVLTTSLMIWLTTRYVGENNQDRIAELATSAETLLRTLEAMPDPVAMWERQPDGRVILTQVNKAAYELAKGRMPEFIGTTVQDFYKNTPEIAERILKTLNTGETQRAEFYFRMPTTGEYKWVLADYVRIDDQRMLSMSRDVTERRQMEEAVIQREARLQSVFRAAPTGIGVVASRVLLDVNQRICDMTGYTREELIGQSSRIFYATDEDFEYVGKVKYDLIRQHGTGTVETRWQCKDGTLLNILLSSTPIDPTNLAAGVTFTALEITERKQAEARLKISEERYRQLFAEMTSGFALHEIICDENNQPVDYRFLEINPAFEKLTGLKAADMLNRTVLEVLPATEQTWIDRYGQVALTGVPAEFEDYFAQLSRHYEIRAFSPRQGQFAAIFHDVTEQKRAQAAERAQRAFADALRDVVSAVNSTLDLDEVLRRILARLEVVVQHDAANIMLFEGGLAYIGGNRGYETRGSVEWTNTLIVHIDDRLLLRQLVDTGQGYIVSDTSKNPGWVHQPQTSWIKSLLAIPIRVESKIIGVLNLDSAELDHFTLADMERLQAFADQAATAIHHARLYAQVQLYSTELERRVTERTADLSLRNTIVETLSHSLDIQQILDDVLNVIMERFSVCGGAIYLLDGDGSSLQVVAHEGVPIETLNLVMGFGSVGSKLVPSPYLIDEAGEVVDIVQRTGIHAAITVPIWQQEQVQGMLTLVHDQPRPWPNEQAHMLDQIGRQIGVALSNARLYDKLAHDEAHLRTILHSVTEGIMVFDRDQNLTLMNPATEKLLTFYPADLGGSIRAAYKLGEWIRWREQNADEVLEFALPIEPLVTRDGSPLGHGGAECHFPSRMDVAWPCWLQVGISEDETINVCPVHQRITTRAIQAQSAEIRAVNGEVHGRVIALHDVTYFRELDEMKRQFVSTVSHELRNPLAALLLQISSLHRYYDRFAEDERRRMVTQVQQHAYGLRELVEDILELSRFDAGRSLPQKEYFDLVEKCHTLFAIMQPLIRDKNLTFDPQVAAETCYLHADPNQIARVVRNLLENAIKYTPDGGKINLKLNVTEVEVSVSVMDTGIGIPPEKLVYIFDRFFRTEEASKMASGSGLGLAITKQIVDLHGGRIEVQSAVGQGSTFTVTLPLNTIPMAVYPV